MSILPPGYRSIVMPMTRAGDPDPYAITWAYDGDGADYETPQDEVDGVQANFATLWGSSLPNDCTIGPAVMRVGQDGGEPIIAYASGTTTGTSTAEFTTQNVAFLIQKRSQFGGRRNRGRCYFPGVTEASVNEVGVITPTQLASWQSIANDWLTSYNDPEAGFGQMVILHSSAPSTPTPVVSLTVSNMVATQRRRLRR